DARKAAVFGVHVVATTAGQAMAAGDKRMANDRIANLDPLDALAHFLHPSGVFVTHDVGEIDVDFTTPNAFDDVQISAADAGSPDSHDHVGRAVDFRVREVLVFDELLGRQLLVI